MSLLPWCADSQSSEGGPGILQGAESGTGLLSKEHHTLEVEVLHCSLHLLREY